MSLRGAQGFIGRTSHEWKAGDISRRSTRLIGLPVPWEFRLQPSSRMSGDMKSPSASEGRGT